MTPTQRQAALEARVRELEAKLEAAEGLREALKEAYRYCGKNCGAREVGAIQDIIFEALAAYDSVEG